MQRVKNIFHLVVAFLANVMYGFPSGKIKVIGVTGTDGKTTTTHLIGHVLKAAGKKTSMISTISAPGLHTTTPSPFVIQRLINQAVNQGEEFFVLETTSHGLDQNRAWGIKFEVGVITNITHEHLDYHKTYENYVGAKLKLLKQSKTALVNKGDASFEMIRQSIGDSNFKTYNGKGADFNWNEAIKSEIPGEYNKENILAAVSTCRILGIEEEEILAAVKTFQLPKGRMEVVYDKDFKVIIDFAHTPHAISSALNSLSGSGRIIHVFGAAGHRDASKRANMGRASGKFASIVILTEEDHRTESVEKISEEIAVGLKETGFKNVESSDLSLITDEKIYSIETNREKALGLAISIAQKGDLVIATGKSHEKSLARGHKEYPWDEFEAINKGIRNR